MSKRSSAPSEHQSTRHPPRKRQRLLPSKLLTNKRAAAKYTPPCALTLRCEFEQTISQIEATLPRQANLEELVNEWNARLNELGINASNPSKNNIAYLCSKLNAADLELMEQITSLGKETLDHALQLRDHSSTCVDIMLDKLAERARDKEEALSREKADRDQIRIPSKDIWALSERVNYFRSGAKAAIKTEVNQKESKYIVSTIVTVNRHEQACFVVDDEDPRKQQLRRAFSDVMPLPTLAVVSLAKRTLFQPGHKVLAVYPSTTCFYVAKIVKTPHIMSRKQTKYSLQFEDDGAKIKDIEAEKIMPLVE